jgi:hypothetical protein
MFTVKTPACQCLLQHFSQNLNYGNSQDAPLLMNELRNVAFIFNGILFSHKEE